MEESIWKKGVRKDASTKGLGSCYRVEEGIHITNGHLLFVIGALIL